MGPGAGAATPLLARLLVTLRDVDTGDGYLGHQSAVARALGEIGDPRAIEPLVRALQLEDGPPGSRVGRQAIAAALGSFGPRAREADAPLARAVEACPDDACRLAVTEALARIRAAR
jgi:HEAT repeat protein